MKKIVDYLYQGWCDPDASWVNVASFLLFLFGGWMLLIVILSIIMTLIA